MLARRFKAVLQIWWIGLFTVGGVALFAWIGWSAWDEVGFMLRSVKVEGNVVDIRSRTETVRRDGRNEEQTFYSTTVEYRDAAARTHRFSPDVVAGVPVLGPIPVRYDAEHPENARVARFGETWGLLLLQLPFALVMTLGSAWAFVSTWKSAVPPPARPVDASLPLRAPPPSTTAPLDPNAVAKSIARHRRRRGTP